MAVERARHLGVEREAVLAHDSDARVNVVGGVAGEVIAFARQSGGHMDTRPGRLAGVELPEGFVSGPPGSVEMVWKGDNVPADVSKVYAVTLHPCSSEKYTMSRVG